MVKILKLDTVASFNGIDVRVTIVTGSAVTEEFGAEFLVEATAIRDDDQYNYDDLPCETIEDALKAFNYFSSLPEEMLYEFSNGEKRDWLF